MNFSENVPKNQVFEEIRTWLSGLGLTIVDYDDKRPWGGYFVIDESQSAAFIETFFPHLKPDDFKNFRKLSPKILLVAPRKRLSWQYHLRRSEIWKVAGGSVSVAVSATDDENSAQLYKKGDIVELEKGERHRLIGVDQWGIIAEIWKHTDPDNPSDENDIIRVQDDFGR